MLLALYAQPGLACPPGTLLCSEMPHLTLLPHSPSGLQDLQRQLRENEQAASEGREAAQLAVELRHRYRWCGGWCGDGGGGWGAAATLLLLERPCLLLAVTCTSDCNRALLPPHLPLL